VNDLEVIEMCTQALDKATPEYNKLERYYKGEQPIAYLPDEVRIAVGTRLKPLIINWPRITCNVVDERLEVDRFRLPNSSEFSEATEIWQANEMDEESPLVHLDALLYGRSFVSVWSGAEGMPQIAAESARECWVETDPVTREPRFAIKRWWDPHERQAFLNIYRPEEISKWKAGVGDAAIDISNLPANAWVRSGGLDNPLGVVPLVPFINRRRILVPTGESELTDVLPLADAINKLGTDLMISSEFHSMPRRWATGVEVVEDDEGNVQETFSMLKGRTWVAEDSAARIGSLPEADLQGFISAIEAFSIQLMSLGHIPPHYGNAAKGSLASADSIRASEASLVSVVRQKMRAFGGAWEDVLKLALRARNGELTEQQKQLETQWRNPEIRTESELVDAAIKRKALGIPDVQAWEDLGYTEAQIKRMKKLRDEQQAEAVQRQQEMGLGPTGTQAVAEEQAGGSVGAAAQEEAVGA
jgi:Phage portal protein, SPP1 Gp6-like